MEKTNEITNKKTELSENNRIYITLEFTKEEFERIEDGATFLGYKMNIEGYLKSIIAEVI